MTILSHIETAEEALRQALINALAEKQDKNLTDLFNALNNVRELVGKLQPSKYNFNLTSEYLPTEKINYNFTGLDEQPYGNNVITFGNGGVSIYSNSEDRISLGPD
jgi:hypothetical protein